MSKICALCKKEPSIKNSHIVPSFVFKWLKDTSATGYLRDIIQPNLRKQDGFKFPLLCQKCETKLSLWENKFYKEIFLPYQNENQGLEPASYNYDDWLLKFVISVSWRNILAQKELIKKKHLLVKNIS